MAMRSPVLALTALLGVVPMAQGANVIRITPAPAFAGVAPMAVKGRSPTALDKRIRFGAWRVSRQTTFDAREQSVGAAVDSSSTRKELALRRNLGDFELDVARDGGEATRVRCETRAASAEHGKSKGRRSDETSLALPGYPRIDCTFSGVHPGMLAVQAAPVTLFESGHADLAGKRWQIRSVGKLVRLGYELLFDDTVVATVETASAGRVWLLPTLEARRQEEAAVLAGALLYSTAALELQDP